MKKSLSLFASIMFASICMLFSVNAFAQDTTTVTVANVIDNTNTVISVMQQDIVYDGAEKKPDVTVTYNGIYLNPNTDYSVTYSNNIVAGKATVTVTGINSYSGTATKDFTISPASLSKEGKTTVSLDKSSYVCNNQEIKPVVNVAYNNGSSVQNLIQNIDFTVTYSNNTLPGRAKVKITGIGNYKDSVTKTFDILPSKVTGISVAKNSTTSASINWLAQSGVTGYQVLVYNPSKNIYEELGTAAADATSYTVSGLNNGNIYYFEVRAYKVISDKKYYGDYSDIVSTVINPSKVKLTSVTLNKSTLCIEWKKVNCSGYIISYSTDKKFKKNVKTINIKKSSTTSRKVKKLDKNKKYYVKVKAYVASNGQNYYGENSTMLSTYYSNVYATYYSYYVNNKDRTTNLQIASKKINGTIIQPGETFNFNTVVGSRTASKGYKKAHVFSGGGVSMGLAGGICQVASTCFNTALIGNVQIVERHQHSQRVSYVPLGRDAAIYGNVQNLRWKNNTKYAIRVGMEVKNGKISCTFYTCEKAKPKKVSLNVTQKGDRFTIKRVVDGKVNYKCNSKY